MYFNISIILSLANAINGNFYTRYIIYLNLKHIENRNKLKDILQNLISYIGNGNS
jgi:hypothetical protein